MAQSKLVLLCLGAVLLVSVFAMVDATGKGEHKDKHKDAKPKAGLTHHDANHKAGTPHHDANHKAGEKKPEKKLEKKDSKKHAGVVPAKHEEKPHPKAAAVKAAAPAPVAPGPAPVKEPQPQPEEEMPLEEMPLDGDMLPPMEEGAELVPEQNGDEPEGLNGF